MTISFSKNFIKLSKKLNKPIRQKLLVRIEMFTINPLDLELNNHPLKGKYKKYRSINVTRDFRALYLTQDDHIIFYRWHTQSALRLATLRSEQARLFLASYRTEPAQTNSAVVVTNTETGKKASDIDIAKTFFKPIPPHVVDGLIEDGAILQSAGAFLIENPIMSPYIDHIEGTRFSVMGLPLDLTFKLIEEVS
jgi:addiction module RelE/StbE family toxin